MKKNILEIAKARHRLNKGIEGINWEGNHHIMSAHSQANEHQSTHILCVGAAVLDTIFRVSAIPSGQGKVLPSAMLQVAEGMASSAAFAIAQMSGRVSLWSSVGDDAAGAQILKDLGACGIDVSGIVTVKGARSALSTILVDDHGERLIVPFYDPLLHRVSKPFTPEHLKQFDAVLVDVRWPELAYEVLKTAKSMDIAAILDGDVAPVDTLMHLASEATHIIFSEPAAASLSGESDGTAMLKAIRQILPQAFISVTFGEKGSYWMEAGGDTVEYHTTLHVDAVDTLAAGDVFHGTFAQGLAEGLATVDIVRLASAAAALKCKVFGGRLGTPTRCETEVAVAEWIGNSD
jgi:sulfofructose kinase